MYLYGYRTEEQKIKIPTPPDATRFKLTPAYHNYDPSYRPPVSMTKVKTIPAIPPKPDNTHPDSLLLGVAKRMAYEPPRYNRLVRRKFRKFVRKWCETNLKPLDSALEFDFEEWLTHTNYTEGRKKEIREARRHLVGENGEIDNDKARQYVVKLFTKEEYYPEYKHHRGIYAREDAAKALFGPYIHYVEEQLFKLPYFIKKVPKNQRPEYINNFMKEEFLKYQATDYTSFESHFVTDMMRDCEFILYRYMASENIKAMQLVRLMFMILAGTNRVVNRYFTLYVDAKRQSGEMNTSLGNGFSNLMFLLFACHRYKLRYSGPIIEGDDALIGLNAPVPNQYYVDMGLNVKLEAVDDISEGSFCGLVYDPVECQNIRDPRETLATIAWVPKKYAFCNKSTYYGLIKSKALSLIYEYPGCPIVNALGRRIFDLTAPYTFKISGSTYDIDRFHKAHKAYVENKLPVASVGPRTRMLMEKIFNIPVNVQYAIESDITKMSIHNFDIPSALTIMPDCWISNYNNYVGRFGESYHSITHPSFPYPDNYAVDRLIQLGPNDDPNRLLTFAEFNMNRLVPSQQLYDQYVWRKNLSIRIHADNRRPITIQDPIKDSFVNPPPNLY